MVDDPNSTVCQETVTFLDENPDCESDLETLLEIDSSTESWEFDDIPLDSGAFGEIVSREIATADGDAYHLTDPAAVRAALSGETVTTEESKSNSALDIDVQVDRNAALGLVGALLVVVVARAVHIRSVFYEGRVISPGNDPYFFRYWQEQLLAESAGVHSLGVLVNPPWDDGSFNQRPLTHATNWWFAELLGGGQWGADMVAAWLPLAFTLALAVVVYYLTLLLTRDVRVGLASVLVLALAPIHANYTGLGLLHHRYNQYLWFGVILLTIVWLATDLKRRRAAVGPDQAVRDHAGARKSWYVAGLLGVALAFWTHSWGGSLELFGALGVYVALRVCLDVREGISPGWANLPLVGGFAFGGLLAMTLHLGLGWHGLPAPLVTFVAALVVGVLVALGELWYRRDRPARQLLVAQGGLGIASALSVVGLLAVTTDVISTVISMATPSDAPDWQTSIQSETLYGTDQFVLFGPVVQIGFEFYLALAILLWAGALVYRCYEPGWLLLVVVTIHYLVLSGIMVRFAGRLVIAMAVLAGLGVVATLAWVGLVSRPFPLDSTDTATETIEQPVKRRSITIPTAKRSTLIVGISLLIFLPSLIFVPTLMSDLTHDRAHFDATSDISDHAETFDRESPDDRVLTPWGNYRYYNYFVSGDSESERFGRYGYVRLQQSGEFDEELERGRGGYILFTDFDISSNTQPSTLGDHLGTDRFDDSPHLQLLYTDSTADIASFALVSGATIEIDDPPEREVTVEAEIDTADRTFTYVRTERVDDGSASVTVPYPGTYDVGGETVTVSPEDVEEGVRTTV